MSCPSRKQATFVLNGQNSTCKKAKSYLLVGNMLMKRTNNLPSLLKDCIVIPFWIYH